MSISTLARSITLASALAASGAAVAANDGSIGATSSGDLQVTLAVGDRVRISSLNDIALGGYTGAGDLVGSDAFCAYRNGTGLYSLSVASANAAAGVYRARKGAKVIPYTVRIDDDVDASNGLSVVSGATVTGLQGSATSASCSGSDNAALEVTFAAADLQGANAGAYTDTLTLLVQPN